MSNIFLFFLVSLKKTTSTWHIMKEIWAELGYRGLFAGTDILLLNGTTAVLLKLELKQTYLCVVSLGFMPRVIKVAPACAVMISTYEFGKAFFQKMNVDRERLRS